MKKLVLLFAFAFAFVLVPHDSQAQNQELQRWEQQARNVTITRDDWGIAHVYGKTDADAVFGMIYAQAEDDFNRVETNYINSIGRLAEAEGESAVWRDLRMKIFIDPAAMKIQYEASPAWLKSLMNAWADGLNFYLAEHPGVKPRVIKHFEPWMALTFSEGSIGGDIETINLNQLQAFYGNAPAAVANGSGTGVSPVNHAQDARATDETAVESEPGGSNGVAIAPLNTAGHHALLLINPHTSFYFRSELQMASDEGLNAYGAVTWGQFFIYQGFNEHCGWMHTSSAVDAIDEYLETVVKKGDQLYYKYGGEERPVTTSVIKVPYKAPAGMSEKTFTVFRTQHGPIIRSENGKWVSISLMQEPLKALTQSYTRIKAKDYKEFKQTLELHTNSSNNTIFADAEGDIAYFHGNFIPRRDPKFDWTKPVDGSDPATDWQGLLSVDDSPKLLNPASGWLYNSNNAPWSAAGPSSPRKSDYPAYVDNGVESARGLHAIRVLQNQKDFTLDSLISAAYDSYLTWFEKPIPALVKAWDQTPATDPLKAKLSDQIALLRSWDLRWSMTSVPTSLAVFWAEDIQRTLGVDARSAGMSLPEYVSSKVPAARLLISLSRASDKLTTDFGTWKTPWGNINRFQRLTDDIVHPFNDGGPSIPVGFTSAIWGSLASFAARPYKGSKKIYGTSGNSFVAVVEFGKTVRAKAVTAGGENGNPSSPHFNDQAKRYSTGDLREVYFYRSQLKGHTEREYHPGNYVQKAEQ
ncbi:MAG: acylase [Acidobacteria bacterium]|nr:MAG: acylase [Acidobacteriota bacterium]